MNQLQLTFLGPFTVRHNRQIITDFESNKVRALLVYLAVEPGEHTRSTLAALLWPGYGEANARANLRQALYELRRTIGDEHATPPFLTINRQSIGLNPVASCSVDVTHFRQHIAATVHHTHADLATCEACLGHLQQAVDLYHNDFLTGFALDDSTTFEEWRRITQEQCHLQFIDALYQLAAVAVAQGDDTAVLRYAQRQLALEPWHEEAHRQIMRALAQGGKRAAALMQYENCCKVLATELGIEPDAVTFALYTQIRNGAYPPQPEHDKALSLETLFPNGVKPLSSSSSLSPRSKPVSSTTADAFSYQLTPFIGRTAEIDKLIQLLRRAEVRLITLLGPGGIGKSRLAQQIGQLQKGAFDHNVFFIPLAGLIDGEGLAAVLATTLELAGQGMEPLQALIQFLRDKRVLLILDNFEHLLDHVLLIVQLLEAAPSLKVLVTSRERLYLSGEQIFVLKGLEYPLEIPGVQASLPMPNEVYNLDAIVNGSPACQLFCQCAQRVVPHFQPTNETIPDLLRICHLVEGMPLALEMAASWLETLPLKAIADEISQSADFLAMQRRDAPARQQSIRAVFNWSWQLLNQQERQALRRCALFRGGFTRAAAVAVSNINPHALANLIQKSFIQFSQQTADGRYQIHELLRQFAVEQLELADETELIATTHSAYYLNLLATHKKGLGDIESSMVVATIQMELDNIHQAWNWAIEHVVVDSLSESAYTLGEFYSIAGLAAQGAQTFANAYDALRTTEVNLNQEDKCQWLLATFLALQADFLLDQGKVNESVRCLEAGYPLSQTTGNRWAEASCGLLQAIVCWRQGAQREAETKLEQTLQWVQNYAPDNRSDYPLANVELSALLWLAHPATVRGDYQRADKHYAEGLVLARRIGNRRVEFAFLLNTAGLAVMRYNWRKARQIYTTILPLATELRFPWGEASVLLEFGLAVRYEGEYEFALEMCQRALPIFQKINDQSKTILTLLTCALIYGYRGEREAVKRLLVQVSALLQQHEDRFVHNYARLIQATLAWLQGDFALGVAHADAGLAALDNQNDLLHRAHLLIMLGHNQASRYQDNIAQSAYKEALSHYVKLNLPMLAAEAQAGLAELALRAGDLATALSYIETVLTTLHEEPYAGYDEPFFVYLTCYQVLTAVDDPRAPTLLTQGYRLLQAFATKIQTERGADTFLKKVSTHRALYDAHEAVRSTITTSDIL